MDNNQSDVPVKKYPFSWDLLWIAFTVIFYILANGASPYVRSFFVAGYLQ